MKLDGYPRCGRCDAESDSWNEVMECTLDRGPGKRMLWGAVLCDRCVEAVLAAIDKGGADDEPRNRAAAPQKGGG